jgi:hypothetical protein
VQNDLKVTHEVFIFLKKTVNLDFWNIKMVKKEFLWHENGKIGAFGHKNAVK